MSVEITAITFDLGKHGTVTLKPTPQFGDNPAYYSQQATAALDEIAGRIPDIFAAVTGSTQKVSD